MEDWQLDFEWLRVRHFVKQSLRRDDLPDLNALLFLIGIQELGLVKKQFGKEEKQDLMHIAVCRLLEPDGYFRFDGLDADGWPHYTQIGALSVEGLKQQERLLQEKIIAYFNLGPAD